MIFETSRLVIRTLEPADEERYFSLHGDPVIMRYIRVASTREQCNKLLREHIELNKQMTPYGRWLAYDRVTNDFIGSFVIIPIVNSDLMQLGYSLLKEHWGKGYATEMVLGGLDYLANKTPLETIYAIAEEDNVASQKALLKAGFKEEMVLKEGEKVLRRFMFELH